MRPREAALRPLHERPLPAALFLRRLVRLAGAFVCLCFCFCVETETKEVCYLFAESRRLCGCA